MKAMVIIALSILAIFLVSLFSSCEEIKDPLMGEEAHNYILSSIEFESKEFGLVHDELIDHINVIYHAQCAQEEITDNQKIKLKDLQDKAYVNVVLLIYKLESLQSQVDYYVLKEYIKVYTDHKNHIYKYVEF